VPFKTDFADKTASFISFNELTAMVVKTAPFKGLNSENSFLLDEKIHDPFIKLILVGNHNKLFSIINFYL
jgi:hypothetical protein